MDWGLSLGSEAANLVQMRFHLRVLALVAMTVFGGVAAAEEATGKKTDEPKAPIVERLNVTKSAVVSIAGKPVAYAVTTGKITIRDAAGLEQASIFSISYVRDKTESQPDRPVMFAFNGGPGSSSVWLHLGILGPKRVAFPDNGLSPITPPARLVGNEFSILDACDLVFIDPISTGYSRAAKPEDAKNFHGVQSDIESVGEFIRQWLTKNKRWDSPKYLCGESYGGIRAAGLADYLQDRYGMSLNGVILLSSLLDYRTIIASSGSQLSHQIYLPAFTTTALYHGKIQGNRDELLKAARELSFSEYGVALLKGNTIGDEELSGVSAKLEKLTGLTADFWKRHQLRVDPFEFRAELLRDQGKVVGRFDSRVAWDADDQEADSATYDPSFSLAIGAYSTAMLAYLTDELGWEDEKHYEILTTDVYPWSYGADNRIINMTDKIVSAIRENPKLKVLVMGAYADLATPPDGVRYSFSQAMNFPENLRGQVKYAYYDSGHMFYTNLADLAKARADLLDFLGKN